MRLLAGGQGEYHDGTGNDEVDDGGLGRAVERLHQETIRISATIGHEIIVSIQSCQGHTDEVHQVVAGKGHRQGKGTHHHDDLEDIHPTPVEYLHQDGEANEATGDNHPRVLGHPQLVLLSHEGRVLQPLDEHEVDDGRSCQSTEEADGPLQTRLIIEGEDDARNPLHQCTEEEGYGHTEEDTKDDGEGLLGVQQVIETEHPCLISSQLDESQHKGTAQ